MYNNIKYERQKNSEMQDNITTELKYLSSEYTLP